jgi:hypothetical protein
MYIHKCKIKSSELEFKIRSKTFQQMERPPKWSLLSSVCRGQLAAEPICSVFLHKVFASKLYWHSDLKGKENIP